jgi:hypothetical protein
MMAKTTKAADTAAGRRERWAKHVADWQRSGRSQRAFCAERRLALLSFQWWRARLRRADAPGPGFLPIALGGGEAAVGAVIEVELRSRTRLRLEGEAALRAVDRVVARIR